MNWIESSHQILSALVLATWFSALALLVLRRTPAVANGVSLSVLGIFVVVISINLLFVFQDMPSTQKIWARGWIGPRDQSGAITIGIIQDTLGLTFTLLSALLGLFLLSNVRLLHREERLERIHSGTLMGVAGIAVAWLSLTPWLSLMGLTLTSLGAFVMLESRQDPESVAQFGKEKTLGFVLSFLGAAVLAGGRAALTMERSSVFAPPSFPHVFDVIGAVLLLSGLFFHFHPVPFMNWLVRPPKPSSASSVIVAQVFSGLAVFGLAVRFEPELKQLGVFPVFEWIALSSVILTAVSGLAQESWKATLSTWVSSGLCFSFAALCASGGANAVPILVGVAISASAIALLAGASESEGVPVSANRWLGVFVFLAVAPGIGFIGTVSAGGIARILILASQDPARAAGFSIALLLTQLTLWKSVYGIVQAKVGKARSAPASLAFPLSSAGVLLLFSLGLVWTGTFTGGLVPQDPDRMFISWLSVLFGTQVLPMGDESSLALGLGLFGAVLVCAALLGYWLFGRGYDRVVGSLEKSEALMRFLQTGYSAGRLWDGLMRGLKTVGGTLEYWITDKISLNWVPTMLESALRFPATLIDRADKRVYAQEESILRQWVEVPAKTLQLIQNGDLQWYLVFAISGVVAILVHFLRI